VVFPFTKVVLYRNDYQDGTWSLSLTGAGYQRQDAYSRKHRPLQPQWWCGSNLLIRRVCLLTLLILMHRSYFHVSSFTPDERVHITAALATATDWDSDPRQTNALVHVYCAGNQLKQGFESYWLVNPKKNQLKSPAIRDKVDEALGNPV
jgi:hypothetical protein